ncbi:MAG: CDP-diacylglycerol--glycerol-3-phosphate 3-phosphatidyltransferase [Longimicrobiales bacterium]|nr:CDP-diacylglycerol--glycerol-3-phosphate 3-phosphatidyltransferase [Longimicrobiales bacterium]
MERRLSLPNLITLARIVACPVIAFLALSPGLSSRLAAFVLFIVAALSDLYDGYLARRYGWITDVGKLLDPLADKLLLAATFIPIWLISIRPDGMGNLPFIGPLPLWVLFVIFGREIFVTLFRQWAVRRGEVLAAGRWGKYKALSQFLFAGGALLWYPVQGWAHQAGWIGGRGWRIWYLVHGSWVAVTLVAAILLTIGSMVAYLRAYRRSGELG